MVPYKFLKYLVKFYEIHHWNLDRYCNESIDCLGCMDILMMLILLIHEHGMCFHLFVSSSISFFSVVSFSQHESFTSLVRFIPRYFILFEAIVNGIDFLISLPVSLLLV